MKKPTVMLILLCVLAVIILGGFIAEIILAAQYTAPWYIIFWSIVTPVCAIYFICKRIISCIKAIKQQNHNDK